MNGDVLMVDLSPGTYRRESLSSQVRRSFLGGRGTGVWFLASEPPFHFDPLGPQNRLVFSTGLLCGTAAQGFSRWVAVTKSPLTDGVMRAVGGGHFGAALRSAGIEVLAVTGRATEPVCVVIHGSDVRIEPADDLWGLDTEQTQVLLRKKYGSRAQVACIGPAGERQVRFAAIVSGRRTAARGGVGAVMGAKNLKAVVAIGTGRVRLADPDAFRLAVRNHIAVLERHPRRLGLTDAGTTVMTETANLQGWFPVFNFRQGRLTGYEELCAEAFGRWKVGNFGCYGCMTRCGQVHRVPEGPLAGSWSEGPEYETIWALGGALGNRDRAAVIEMDARCDLLGLDTISTGGVMAFACELFEHGLLSPSETDGLVLAWGNHRHHRLLLERIARREGLGSILAEGVRRAADLIGRGAARYAMHAKGLELPGYDPRAIKGYALSYATSNIGGSHMYGRPRDELYGRVDRFSERGKGPLIAAAQTQQAANETFVVCNFANSGLSDEILSDLVRAATGDVELSDPAHWRQVGERVVCLERCYNVIQGMSRKDDALPLRFLLEPLVNAGPSTGQVVRALNDMLDEYYDCLGYSRNGVPGLGKLQAMGLAWLMPELRRMNG